MVCPNCGVDNVAGQKFCGECGTRLLARCLACAADNPPGQRFCGECGAPLAQATVSKPANEVSAVSTAERRLVSVLFADLVGFTSLASRATPRRFASCLILLRDRRTLIGRYGGVVEKFIGDAVMAVWGIPAVTENDAERAVRAALELLKPSQRSARKLGAPGLRARAGC